MVPKRGGMRTLKSAGQETYSSLQPARGKPKVGKNTADHTADNRTMPKTMPKTGAKISTMGQLDQNTA